MPVRAHRPSELSETPFTVATARAAGLSDRMLQGDSWRRLTRGVYADARLEVTDELRLQALRLALPRDAVATDLTAAWLHGVWRPPPGALVPLHFAMPKGRARPPGSADLSHRATWWRDDVIAIGGLQASAPMRNALELARRACLVEAVVLIDAFAYSGLIDLPWFWAYLDAHRRWPGVRGVREAAELATSRARSSGESRLRMIPVLGGLPPPIVNGPVYRDGVLIAYLDLWLTAGRREVGVEYDGAYHESAVQRHADNRRENLLGGNLLRYDRYTVARQIERTRAHHEMARALGLEPPHALQPRWFADPRRPLRW